jgi:hypothetical protein
MEIWKILLAAWSPFILILISSILGYNPLHFLNKKGENKAAIQDTGLFTKIQEAVKIEFNKSYTRYNYLQQRRVQVTEEMYKRLVDVQIAAQVMTQLLHAVQEDAEKEQQERVDAWSLAFNKLKKYSVHKEIYFEEVFNEKMRALLKKYWNNAYDYHEVYRLQKWGAFKGEGAKDYWKEAYAKVKAAGKSIEKEMPDEIEEIKKEIQKIIGMLED